MNHTKIGTCPHCGAPVWARKRARGDNEATDYSPPKAEYSCDCRLAAIPVQTWPTYPQWWQYYKGPRFWYYPYKISCATTTKEDGFNITCSATPTDDRGYFVLDGVTSGTAAVYACN